MAASLPLAQIAWSAKNFSAFLSAVEDYRADSVARRVVADQHWATEKQIQSSKEVRPTPMPNRREQH